MSSPQTTFRRRDWLWLLLIWSVAAVILCRNILIESGLPLFLDTDDAMRMVVVRDFLAGQGWYDLVQHRLNTPYGAEVHWSRLVDLPIAAILWLAQLFVSPATALLVAGTVWPLLLLAVMLSLSARLTLELVGREGLLAGLVLPVLSVAITAEFSPGRVDHHSVIMLLSLAVLWNSVLALRRPIAAWVAGLLAATALAIAIEALPMAIAAILAFGFAFLADPARAANLRRFGLAFAGGTALHLALARPPSRWLEAACDMISPVYVLMGLAVGAAYLIISFLPLRSAALRLLVLAVGGVASSALVILIYPQCLAGPYGNLDPWLQRNWIAVIIEAKPWHASLIDLPVYTTAVGIPVLLGAIAAAIALVRSPGRRLQWLTLLIFIFATALVMLTQIRGARLALLPIVPAAAWLIAEARKSYIARPRIVPALGLIASWLMFAGIALTVMVNAVLNVWPSQQTQAFTQARASKVACLNPENFRDLRGLPPERVMAPIDLGAHILLETPHAVVAAPYHRNQDGVLDAFRFFNRPVAEARQIASQRGLGLLITCDSMPEMQGAGLNQPNTILSLLAAGTPPDWLEDVSLGGPLKIYAIQP